MVTILIPPSTTTTSAAPKQQADDRKQQEDQLLCRPSPGLGPHNKTTTHFSLATAEAKCMASVSLPMVLTGLLRYSLSMISMLFLGRRGDHALAGGALSIGFANITGYSILSGLAMGMEPICGQSFVARRHKLLGLTLQRTVLLLLLTALPIAILWINMKKILLLCGQDNDIATHAQSYILYSLPDLLAQSLLHPIRIYLRVGK